MKTRTTKRWCEWKRVCRPFVFKMNVCGVLLVMAYSTTVRILQALRAPQTLRAALLIIVEPYVIHQYINYKIKHVANTATGPWDPFQSYSAQGEEWFAPWTSPVGLTTIFVLVGMSLVVALRIDTDNSLYQWYVYITVVVSHALYWCIYIDAKPNGVVGYVACCMFFCVAIIPRELFSVYGGNGSTEMNISEKKRQTFLPTDFEGPLWPRYWWWPRHWWCPM